MVQPLSSQHTEDSASNQESSIDGYFDDASSKRSEESHSNQCSSLEDSDDDGSWISHKDAALLQAMTNPSNPMTRATQRYHPHTQRPRLTIRRLPKDTRPVKLVGEGSANAVFEIKVPRGGSHGSEFQGLLLRVAKVPYRGHPPTYNYLLQQRYYHKAIRPILGDHAVYQELVVLHNTGIIDELNDLLHQINHSRKEKFKGTFVGSSDWGFLVEDMRPADPEECILAEFKPKWLSQSPNAPANAIRCRQCAMDLQSLLADPSMSKSKPDRKPCPLAFANPEAPAAVSSPFRLAPQLALREERDHFERVLRNTAKHRVFTDLKTQQDLHDPEGPLYARLNDPLFPVAMTLRDCTCFVQIPRHTSPGNEEPRKLRLGDLDWKDPQVKLDRWHGAEQQLIDGGFYTAEWILCNNIFYHPPTLCLLEWPSSKRTGTPDILKVQPKNRSDKGIPLKHDQLSPLGGKTNHMYQHLADIEALEQALQDFKKELPDTPFTARRNPFRSDPS